MNLEIFLVGLLIITIFTDLATEAIKKWMEEHNKTYCANTLAGYVAVGLSLALGAAYVICTNAAITGQFAVYLIALMFLSWLSAMVGYDKVVQAISQFKTYHKNDSNE